MRVDSAITRAEHEEFRRRLEEENARQDKRISLLEDSVRQTGALTAAVERLATNMLAIHLFAFFHDKDGILPKTPAGKEKRHRNTAFP